MKLLKRLTVNGEEYPIVSENVRLDIDRPGAAIFQVRAGERLTGRVEFSLGWNLQDVPTLFFTGEITISTPADYAQQRLFCCELSARLDDAEPVSLRHPTMKEVLARYAELTGLSFIVPDKPYAETNTMLTSHPHIGGIAYTDKYASSPDGSAKRGKASNRG